MVAFMLLSLRMNHRLIEYLEGGDKSPFGEWFTDLDAVTAARVDKYLRRMEQGNFGDSKGVASGVQELRMDFGPGYRVYYGKEGTTLIILPGGSDKRRQSHEIARAIRRWEMYKKGGK